MEDLVALLPQEFLFCLTYCFGCGTVGGYDPVLCGLTLMPVDQWLQKRFPTPVAKRSGVLLSYLGPSFFTPYLSNLNSA